MSSLRDALERLGHARNQPFGYRADLSPVRPRSLAAVLRASEDPRLQDWVVLGKSWAENVDFAEEAQGAACDGAHWFITSNGNDARDGLYKVTLGMAKAAKIDCPLGRAVHLGAPCVAAGWVYVPIQPADGETTPFGIWKVSTDFSRSIWLAASVTPESNMFAWCDIHPENGLLYTAHWEAPTKLRAYDASAGPGGILTRVEAADIPIIQPTEPLTTSVQGACFTSNHRILMLCDVDHAERIHCHSTLTGVFMGRRSFLADEQDEAAFDRNELEGISLHNLTVNGQSAQVHVLELNNDNHSGDDLYLWHLQVPRPDLL